MAQLRYFIERDARAPFEQWFNRLDAQAAAKATVALARLELGHTARVKSVGAGVFEYKIEFGPGYRIYFGRDGDALVILLTGGTKQRQSRDIARAIEMWHDYKLRKGR